MTFEEWWEANDMDSNPYADRTEVEIAWHAAKRGSEDQRA